ncbi:MAG TPA: hypothetical protein VGG28_26565 [Kofleriaceae bacterium]|jgi:hypothetical protein
MRHVIIIACLASGCATATKVTTEFMPLEAPKPAIAPGEVQLVFSGHVDRPYRELGVETLTVGPTEFVAVGAPPPTQPELIGKLRALAASKGCDALLVNPAAYTRYQTITSAVCIAYR